MRGGEHEGKVLMLPVVCCDQMGKMMEAAVKQTENLEQPLQCSWYFIT